VWTLNEGRDPEDDGSRPHPVVSIIVRFTGTENGRIAGGQHRHRLSVRSDDQRRAAWDNAKKFIEEGHHGGKGSPAHQAL
jgi:Na+/H+-translocating membrane pyrophosphatase